MEIGNKCKISSKITPAGKKTTGTWWDRVRSEYIAQVKAKAKGTI